MELAQYITDTEAMKSGVWIDFQDGRIRIAKFGNPDYLAFIQGRPVEDGGLDSDGKPTPELVDLMCRGLAEHVLLDWEGFTISGDDVPYSKEAAYQALRQFEGFRNQVIILSQQQSHFEDEEFKEAVSKITPFLNG